jgi:Fe-S cluster biogenesis protein NfuA
MVTSMSGMAEPTPLSFRTGSARGGPTSLNAAERVRREQELANVIEAVRPAVQADGGDIELLGADVEAGTVRMQLTGACGSCSISTLTLEAGLARIIKERLQWVREVQGGVDESLSYEESAALGRGAWAPRPA